jgi:hypothetical protein
MNKERNFITKDRIKTNPENIPLDILQCNSCDNILNLQTINNCCSDCGNQYCSNCVYLQTINRKCLNCKNNINFTKIPQTIITKLKKLQIICKYNRCDLIIEYENLNKHEEDCDYRTIKCKFCTNDIYNSEYKEHYDKCKSSSEIDFDMNKKFIFDNNFSDSNDGLIIKKLLEYVDNIKIEFKEEVNY